MSRNGEHAFKGSHGEVHLLWHVARLAQEKNQLKLDTSVTNALLIHEATSYFVIHDVTYDIQQNCELTMATDRYNGLLTTESEAFVAPIEYREASYRLCIHS